MGFIMPLIAPLAGAVGGMGSLGAVAGGGLAVANALTSNSQIKQSINSANTANAFNKTQLQFQNQDQKDKIARNLARFNGAVNATTAQHNIGFDGSSMAILNSALASGRKDVFNTNQNTQSSIWASDQDTANRISQLHSQTKNPLFAGIMGGLQGFTTFSSAQHSYNQNNPGLDHGLNGWM